MNATVPIGAVPVTCDVNVTGEPLAEGLTDALQRGAGRGHRAAAVAGREDVRQRRIRIDDAGAAVLDRSPVTLARLLVQSRTVPVGNARAVEAMIDSTCAGVSEGLSDSISETMPATCGVAMLVPWYWT